MASTNETKWAKLNQWLPEDPVLREDFNADNKKVDVLLRHMIPDAQGEYAGTSTTMKIQVGFAPQKVILYSDNNTAGASAYNCWFCVAERDFTVCPVTFADDGFTLMDNAACRVGRNYRWFAWCAEEEEGA